jgi:hypothetical protein
MTEPWHPTLALGYHNDYSETTATFVVGGLFLFASLLEKDANELTLKKE